MQHNSTVSSWHARLWLCIALFCPAVAHAEIRVPAVIGSHMVLQREMPLPIWGWGAPGEKVTVTLGDNQESTTTGEDGKWKVKLPAMKSGGAPLTLRIVGSNTIELTDILIGEVWVGSGQSNMQWNVKQSANPDKEIAAGNYPKMRLFFVPLVPSGTPAPDVQSQWNVCSPTTVGDFSAVAYYFGRELHKTLDVPVGMIATSWGGTRIEPWIPPVGFQSQLPALKTEYEQVKSTRSAYQKTLRLSADILKPWLASAEKAIAAGQELPDPPPLPNHPFNNSGAPTGLYNGMIHPIVPFAIRGALWYQGESNRGQGMHYHDLMKGLISGWRTVWDEGDFPFLYVQLAPYRYGGSATQLPEIWEAQTATLSVPNTGMAVTTDIGNINDIHPTNKQEVGRRLSLWALAKTYGKEDVVYSGPQYESMSVDLEEITLKFKYSEGGLASRDHEALTWFTIAGDDKKFVPATATIAGDTVVVQSPQVRSPVAVRFAWHQLAEPNLVNKAGLPAIPFRTDKWDDALPDFPADKK